MVFNKPSSPTCGDKMIDGIEVTLLGELKVVRDGQEMALPSSRKARALLAFLITTQRPHRRERLCELFWDLPDDPKAALRWSLSKLRKVVDSTGHPRIIADRERVSIDTSGMDVDVHRLSARMRDAQDGIPLTELETMAGQLNAVFLDGLDSAGDEAFTSWLIAEREDMLALQANVLRQLATHPKAGISARKWLRLWHEIDPEGAENYEAGQGDTDTPAPPARAPEPPETKALRTQRIGFCNVPDGTKIAFATLGEGPPLLKAANWLTHLEFDWGTPIWGKCFGELARSRSFIRYDERGCGLSDWEVEDLSFDAFVEDLETVADKLSLDRFPLLGISQGAAVCVEYAVRHPERVSGLILVGGYAAGWRHLSSPEEQARREAVRSLTEVGWGTDNPAYRHIFSQTFMPDAHPEDLAWFDDFQRRTTSAENAARFQDAFGYIDVRHQLSKVQAPTIVLHSRHDQRIPYEVGRAMASDIPDARFVTLESRNHVLVDYEPAWGVCMNAIQDFLVEQGI